MRTRSITTPRSFLLTLATLALAFTSCSDDSAGTGSQAGNALELALVDATGAPAAGAHVRILPAFWLGTRTDTPPVDIDTTLDATGTLRLHLPSGDYVVEAISAGDAGSSAIGAGSSATSTPGATAGAPLGLRFPLRALADLPGTIGLTDTLRPFGNLTGQLDTLGIGAQLRAIAANPTDTTLATFRIALAGTERVATVDSLGHFDFGDLPPGELQLVVIAADTVRQRLEPDTLQPDQQLDLSTAWGTAWSWDFGPQALDASVWTADTGMGPDADGWGNSHLSHPTSRAANLAVNDTTLVLTALQESYGTEAYTSGRIQTLGKQELLYGRVEARVKFPRGTGILALFSLQGDEAAYGDWPGRGSIDVASFWGQSMNLFLGQLHWINGASAYTVDQATCGGGAAPDLDAAFHDVAVEWRPGRFEWFQDGVSCGTLSGRDAPFDHPQHLRLEIQVGGIPVGAPIPATTFPQKFEVDWVKVSALRLSAP